MGNFSGTHGADSLYLTESDDYADAKGGNDFIRGRGGWDEILGGDGDDHIYGDGGNDTLRGGLGNDSINGGSGNDWIYAGSGSDSLYGEDGNDTFFSDGADGWNSYHGGTGFDTITIDDANYYTYESWLRIKFLSGIEKIINLEYKDAVIWADGFLDLENVTVSGFKEIRGERRGDSITGTNGGDIVYGGKGEDILYGINGTDRIFGEEGNDILVGGAGSDLIDGGIGSDTADYGASLDSVNIDLAAVTASGGDASADTLISIENLDGSAHSDTLIGDFGANRLSGNGGNDTLAGREGSDTLLGGGGADLFLFEPGWGSDTVVDFQDNTDTLKLDGFAGVSDAGDALAKATQDSADVVFDFGAGDVLRVTGVTKAALSDDIEVVPGPGGGGGGGGNDPDRTTVQASGYTNGSAADERFVVGSAAADVHTRGGSDLLDITAFASSGRHKIRDFGEPDVLDVSDLLPSGATADPHGHVRLVSLGWSGGKHMDLQVDADGGADSWKTAVRLEKVGTDYPGDFTVDALIAKDALRLGDGGPGDSGSGNPPDEPNRTTIQASGYTPGTSADERFVMGTTAADVLGKGGSDLFEITDLASSGRHKIRNLDTDDVVDLSALLSAGASATNHDGHVRLVALSWSGGAHMDLQVDQNGGGNSWQTAARLQDVGTTFPDGLTIQGMIDDGALLL